MAQASRIAAGAASGAAAGSVVPGWGTAIGAVAGGLLGAMGDDGGAADEQAIARANLVNSQDQQAYAQRLNALAMQRALAGSMDSQGSSVRYNPNTNTWESTLGAIPQRVQNAEYQANILRNNVDIPQATANNIAKSVSAADTRQGVSGAVHELESYKPTTGAAETAGLQDASIRANHAAQDPIIQDTLRQFARTGSAAGPVLEHLQRSATDSLNQEMSSNYAQGRKLAADVNSSNQQRIGSKVATLSGASSPTMDYPQMTGSNPNAQLAALINGRAQGAGQAASTGAYTTAFNTQAGNTAANLDMQATLNRPNNSDNAAAIEAFGTLGKALKKRTGSTGTDGQDNGNGYVSSDNGMTYGQGIANRVSNWWNGVPTQSTSQYGTIPSSPTYNPFTGRDYVQQDGVS